MFLLSTHHPLTQHTQDKGRVFREAFLGKLSLLLRGTVAAPADRFGETLADEHMMGARCCGLCEARSHQSRSSYKHLTVHAC